MSPWTIHSMEFFRPEYWSGQPFPSPGDLLNPGIEPGSPALQEDSLPAELPGKPIHPTYSGPKYRCLYYPYYHFFGHSSRQASRSNISQMVWLGSADYTEIGPL